MLKPGVRVAVPADAGRYNRPMAHDDDSGYKQLFSHPEMVRDLLAGFVPFPWAR